MRTNNNVPPLKVLVANIKLNMFALAFFSRSDLMPLLALLELSSWPHPSFLLSHPSVRSSVHAYFRHKIFPPFFLRYPILLFPKYFFSDERESEKRPIPKFNLLAKQQKIVIFWKQIWIKHLLSGENANFKDKMLVFCENSL